MPKFTRNFTAGKMNKSFDERVVPNGEYIDAMNIRMGSTELDEFGAIENTLGNISLTQLKFRNVLLSVDARCIGAFDDGSNETIYWFVHDPNFTLGATGKLDLIVSFNINSSLLKYHVITIDNGIGINTTLNFNPDYLITGVNKIENLLFFTDNYNAPRSINVNKSYAIPPSNLIDAGSIANALILEESLLVIKKPPAESPTVQLLNTIGEQNFLEERFISFAYRYLYADGEYSATSQWSDIAFTPMGFELTVEAYLNEGMINSFNACTVTYYTGGPLVIGIDLLFKQSESNIIKIIEKQNKQDLGIADNIYTSITFDNSKIFTILPEAELLRLYDNVPRFAKAQTLMGNRIMYGNYVEGYDLITSIGQPLQLTYQAKLIQESIAQVALSTTTQTSNYTIDVPHNVLNSILRIDFASLVPYVDNLVVGATINIAIEFDHDSFTSTPSPTQTTPITTISSTCTLAANYSSPYAFSQSVEFQNFIGTIANILPVYDPNPLNPTSCDGVTLTDLFNCDIPTNLSTGFQKRASGITATGQPIKIISSNINSYIDLQLVAMQYENLNNLGNYSYEYYKIVTSNASFSKKGSPRSLHSNRGYEIGIVYMDDFLRSSTALVSPNNAVYTPCSSSENKNTIEVTIPISQVAPYWATRYKFVIKPDQEGYQTIYSTLVVEDNNLFYFLLEGENMQKVQVGDRLIVKKDSSGPTDSCLYTTVLEKEARPVSANFPISGVYMRLEGNNFGTVVPAIPIYSVLDSDYGTYGHKGRVGVLLSEFDGANWIPLDVPQGSTIKFMLYTFRNRYFQCKKREVNAGQYYVTFTATQNYNSVYDWFIANQTSVMSTFNSLQDVQMNITYNGLYNLQVSAFYVNPLQSNASSDVMKLYFNQDPLNNKLYFYMSGSIACNSNDSYVDTKLGFELNRTSTDPNFIFETLPIDASPDIFFENNLSFAISPIGEHEGNIQNQDFAIGQPAIIDTKFFNCFSFGNGAESYKVRDSIVGREFNLGERVTSVSAQDYKEAHRFSDITYSGIYNPESNLNKLNEFNLGLLNYKYLESSFGNIYILDGRETDVLCLQEDKISYVLAGKNLLSDAGAGRALTAVPEVLGTQVARTEKYGISHNPESYVQWGADRYFTDVKRGAVVQIRGNSMQSDQLQVVSSFGMNTYFRDLFINASTTQKLGGYDPYMDEYVLTSNDIDIPSIKECIDCDQESTFNIENSNRPERTISYCIKANGCVGLGNILISVTTISAGASLGVTVTYDNISQQITINSIGSFNIPFNVTNPLITDVFIELVISANSIIVFDVDNACQDCKKIALIQVVITDDVDAGMFIHNQYNYTDTSIAYSSLLQSNQVTFVSGSANPLVSYYSLIGGLQGSGSFPYPGVDMNLYTNKIGFDDYDFIDPPNRFLWHTSGLLYPNNPGSISTLLASSTNITPITTIGNQNSVTFNVPTLFNYLYLIWDLRSTTEVELCYSETSCELACNDCYTPPPCDCGTWLVVNNSRRAYTGVTYTNCNGDENVWIGDEIPVDPSFPDRSGLFLCARDFPEVNRVEGFEYIYLGCYCCGRSCSEMTIENLGGEDIEFGGLLSCGVNDPNETILFSALSTLSVCLSDFFVLGYFNITQGISYINNLDFTPIDCECKVECCDTRLFWNSNSEKKETLIYRDCNDNSQSIEINSNSGLVLCVKSYSPNPFIESVVLLECQCCREDCFSLTIENNGAVDITIQGDILCTELPPNSITYLAGANPYVQCWNKNAIFAITIGAANFNDLIFTAVECDCPQ